MTKLSLDAGDTSVQASFALIIGGNYDQANDSTFTFLDKFVMELFRTISPNTGSISALKKAKQPKTLLSIDTD
ncbi:hypothetical protein NIES2101_01185 [Calothrix sp. HK-06]|nr:hypothetical protein NIES2101_01185 [Calothrix sp. HK-06]